MIRLSSFIPVSYIIEVNVPHLRPKELWNDFVALLYFSCEIVFSVLSSGSAKRIRGCNIIFLVSERSWSNITMVHCSKESVSELILQWRKPDDSSIFKFHHFDPLLLHIQRIHSGTGRESGMSIEPIPFIGSFEVEVSNWWMVGDLLHVQMWTIRITTLESLSKNRIERFVPNMDGMDEAEWSHDDIFHSFDWVCGEMSLSQIERSVQCLDTNQIEHRLVGHAIDRETDTS